MQINRKLSPVTFLIVFAVSLAFFCSSVFLNSLNAGLRAQTSSNVVLAQSLRSQSQIQDLYKQALKFAQGGSFQKAVSYLTQAINIDPNSPKAYTARGSMNIGARNKQAAIADFQRAVQLYKAEGDLENATLLEQQVKVIQSAQF